MTSQNLNLLTLSNLTGEWENYELIGSSRHDISRCNDRKTYGSRLEFQKYLTKSEKSCYTNFSFLKKSSLVFRKHSSKSASSPWRAKEGVAACSQGQEPCAHHWDLESKPRPLDSRSSPTFLPFPPPHPPVPRKQLEQASGDREWRRNSVTTS